MPQIINRERWHTILTVASVLALPLFLVGASLTHFCYSVLRNRGVYEKAEFEVREISRVKYGAKIRYEVALGRIADSEEILYAWRDYFDAKPRAGGESRRRLLVMYNKQASHFSYAGRNLRVLSLRQFERCRIGLYQAIALMGSITALWVSTFMHKRELETK